MRLLSPFRISLVIPTYHPGEEFMRLLERIRQQTILPDEILIINTEEAYFSVPEGSLPAGTRVIHITKQEFDHGGTRNMAFRQTSGDIVIFMTQDAVPADRELIQELTALFDYEQVAAAYARQIPRKDAGPLEIYSRRFNYGRESKMKSMEDLSEMGIKTFFCSDVCAAWRRSAWEQMGGFPDHVIFNEDMILAGELIKAGWMIAYAAQARVIHSHDYTAKQQFRRNFDLGVSQTDYPSVFGLASSGREGKKLVKGCALYLVKTGRIHLIVPLIWQSAWKFLGYRLGRAYRRLPRPLVKWCSMNTGYWQK